MQAWFAYRFLANFGWGTTVRPPSRPNYYDLKNKKMLDLMGVYMGGKNESAPFVFSQLKTEKTEMVYTFITAADT